MRQSTEDDGDEAAGFIIKQYIIYNIYNNNISYIIYMRQVTEDDGDEAAEGEDGVELEHGPENEDCHIKKYCNVYNIKQYNIYIRRRGRR